MTISRCTSGSNTSPVVVCVVVDETAGLYMCLCDGDFTHTLSLSHIHTLSHTRKHTNTLSLTGESFDTERGLGHVFQGQGAGQHPRHASGFRVQGAGFRVQGSGFRVQGSGFRVQGSGFRVQGSGSGFRVQGSGFRVRFRVQGPGFRVQGSGVLT